VKCRLSHATLTWRATSLDVAQKVADRKGKAHEDPPHEPVEDLEIDLEPELEEMNLDSMAIDEGESSHGRRITR
jgi:hypothetical protein